MARNSDEFILAASHEEAFAVPIPTDNFFGVLSHGWDLSFVLLIIEVEVSLLIAAGENRMGKRPFHPSDALLLIIEVQLVDHSSCEWGP